MEPVDGKILNAHVLRGLVAQNMHLNLQGFVAFYELVALLLPCTHLRAGCQYRVAQGRPRCGNKIHAIRCHNDLLGVALLSRQEFRGVATARAHVFQGFYWRGNQVHKVLIRVSVFSRS